MSLQVVLTLLVWKANIILLAPNLSWKKNDSHIDDDDDTIGCKFDQDVRKYESFLEEDPVIISFESFSELSLSEIPLGMDQYAEYADTGIGYRPIVACTVGDYAGDGFCYQYMFAGLDRQVLFTYNGAKPYLTVGHYKWIETQGLQMVPRVQCFVYSFDSGGNRVVLHSSLSISARVLWRALGPYIAGVFDRRFFVHISPESFVYRDPFFVRRGVDSLVNMKVSSRTFFWTDQDCHEGLKYFSRISTLVYVTSHYDTYRRLVSLGLDRNRVFDVGDGLPQNASHVVLVDYGLRTTVWRDALLIGVFLSEAVLVFGEYLGSSCTLDRFARVGVGVFDCHSVDRYMLG
jgi:hypothetical protein